MTAGRALLLTQQSVGLDARKTSMIFLGEALARGGYAVGVVTTQLSRLSALGRGGRLAAVPPARRNRWVEAGALSGFVWVPAWHPLRTGVGWLDTLSMPVLGRYGMLMPRALRAAAAAADLVVIESCSAVALFGPLRRLNPRATFVYSMSDRLDAVGMHPGLHAVLRRDAPRYDLIRVPAAAMLADLPGGRAFHIPHGIDKRVFEADAASPYRWGTRNAVLAGDMMLDQSLLARLAEARPDIDFHCFGRVGVTAADGLDNVIAHGEVPFARLAPYIVHADVGLALYEYRPDLDYLAQSSLKNLQYAYCGLPIVAPGFVAAGLPRAHGYDLGDPASAVAALEDALAAPRRPADPAVKANIRDWDEVAATMVDLARRGATACPYTAHSNAAVLMEKTE